MRTWAPTALVRPQPLLCPQVVAAAGSGASPSIKHLRTNMASRVPPLWAASLSVPLQLTGVWVPEPSCPPALVRTQGQQRPVPGGQSGPPFPRGGSERRWAGRRGEQRATPGFWLGEPPALALAVRAGPDDRPVPVGMAFRQSPHAHRLRARLSHFTGREQSMERLFLPPHTCDTFPALILQVPKDCGHCCHCCHGYGA